MKDPGNRTPRSFLLADLYQEGFCKNTTLPELLLQPQPGTAFVIPDDLRWRLFCKAVHTFLFVFLLEMSTSASQSSLIIFCCLPTHSHCHVIPAV